VNPFRMNPSVYPEINRGTGSLLRAAVEGRPYIIKTKDLDYCKGNAETLH